MGFSFLKWPPFILLLSLCLLPLPWISPLFHFSLSIAKPWRCNKLKTITWQSLHTQTTKSSAKRKVAIIKSAQSATTQLSFNWILECLEQALPKSLRLKTTLLAFFDADVPVVGLILVAPIHFFTMIKAMKEKKKMCLHKTIALTKLVPEKERLIKVHLSLLYTTALSHFK